MKNINQKISGKKQVDNKIFVDLSSFFLTIVVIFSSLIFLPFLGFDFPLRIIEIIDSSLLFKIYFYLYVILIYFIIYSLLKKKYNFNNKEIRAYYASLEPVRMQTNYKRLSLIGIPALLLAIFFAYYNLSSI